VVEAPPLPAPTVVDPDALPSESSTASEYAPNIYRRFNLSVGVAAYDNFGTNLRVSGDAGVGASWTSRTSWGSTTRTRSRASTRSTASTGVTAST
jgi:hypothetical protein